MTRPSPLSKSTALVTGATSGIGLSCSRQLVAAGARVVAAGRREDRLRALAAELGPALHPLPLDVRDRAAIPAALDALPAEFAALDILVNSAGLALGLEPAPKASLEQWEQMIETNCAGLVAVTRHVLPGMVARGRGHVVNLGSIAGTFPYPGGNVYGATKAFVRQFTNNLKADLVGTPLRVTCIEPGMVETEFSVVRFSGDAAKAAKVYENMQPLTADDVAEAVIWCLARPAHVDVTVLELFPVAQGPGGLAVHRGG